MVCSLKGPKYRGSFEPKTVTVDRGDSDWMGVNGVHTGQNVIWTVLSVLSVLAVVLVVLVVSKVTVLSVLAVVLVK